MNSNLFDIIMNNYFRILMNLSEFKFLSISQFLCLGWKQSKKELVIRVGAYSEADLSRLTEETIQENIEEITISPDLNMDKIDVNFPKLDIDNFDISLYTSTGEKVVSYSKQTDGNQLSFALPHNIPKGDYYLRFKEKEIYELRKITLN